MSLRRRVLLGLIAVAVVLGVAGFVIAGTLRSYLIQQVDTRLSSATSGFFRRGPGNGGGQPSAGGRPLSEIVYFHTDIDGSLLEQPNTTQEDPGPKLTGLIPLPANTDLPRIVTVDPVVGNGPRYRVRIAQASDGDYFIYALSLRETNHIFHRIVWVEIIASLSVLGALALSGWWVLRQGVRPLGQIALAADKIAEGDLAHRVPVDDQRTEAGRLGRALNRMLGEIEGSFRRKEESEERLKRFVADASHELRTPLTSIRGYSDLYRQGGLDDPTRLRDAMGRLESEAARMGRLVDDLLLLARLDEGRPLDQEPVDIAVVVRHAVTDAQVIEPHRPFTVQSPAQVMVRGDADRLYQVMANLLTNVRVHTPATSPVDVALRPDDGHVVIAVVDHGPGLTPETLERVFERFYRADKARARVSGGTGLGLSIVAAIVQAHGGEVGVSSTDGEGATFTVTLPVLGAAVVSPAAAVTDPEPLPMPAIATRPPTVSAPTT